MTPLVVSLRAGFAKQSPLSDEIAAPWKRRPEYAAPLESARVRNDN